MATITGTESSDTLPRDTDPDTSGADVIYGLGGNDTIVGGSGADTMHGGTGDDVFLIGGTSPGEDYFLGGDGADRIRLNADIFVSSLILDAAHVAGTETLEFYIYDISGTGGNDFFDISGIVFVGSPDTFYMLDGADSFLGHIGADRVDGGSGNDTLDGGSGNDSLTGGSGNDRLVGGSGDDYFYIGGTDFGLDTYLGGEGSDWIRLNADVVVSRLTLTAATVAGTENLDFYIYDIAGTGANDIFDISGITSISSYDTILMQDGADIFLGHIGADRVDGGSGNDTLNGGAGGDSLTGGSGNDRMVGGSGDDYFYISGTDFGQDLYLGGDGNDRIRLVGDVTTSRLMLTAATATATEVLDFYIYDIAGTAGNDVFNFSGITSASSYDTIYLQEGADQFVGHLGTDYVDGGAGNDTLDGGAGSDRLAGGTGNDRLVGGSGDDDFYIGGNDFGLDVYLGGDGSDRIRLTSDVAVSRLDLSAAKVTGTEILEFYIYDISGTNAADVFDLSGIRSVGNYDWINLLDGNDIFTGHLGDDYVNSGAGNDRLVGGGGNDRLTGGSGSDTAVYSAASAGVTVNLRLETAQAIGGGQGSDTLFEIENIIGSAYSDRLTGNFASNQLIGGAGNDVLAGGLGHDVLNGGLGVDTANYEGAGGGVIVRLGLTGAQAVGGGQGNDTLIDIENVVGTGHGDYLDGSAGNNVLNGGYGNDRLLGQGGNDLLLGGQGNDNIAGGFGDDLLRGQTGADLLTGGAGADRFEFDVNSGADRIVDWQNGSDKILIHSGVWNGVEIDQFSDLTIRQVGANAVVSFGNSTVTFQSINAGLLDASDFIFI